MYAILCFVFKRVFRIFTELRIFTIWTLVSKIRTYLHLVEVVILKIVVLMISSTVVVLWAHNGCLIVNSYRLSVSDHEPLGCYSPISRFVYVRMSNTGASLRVLWLYPRSSPPLMGCTNTAFDTLGAPPESNPWPLNPKLRHYSLGYGRSYQF